jgi:tRNA(Glu) U13 pseudouridine synthase TruD
VVRLDGSGSVFVVEDPVKEAPRLASGDIHLTGPMSGPKMKRPSGLPADLEARAASEAGLSPAIFDALARFVDGTRRDLVARPAGLDVSELGPGVLELRFSLSAGSYATEVVRNFTHGPFFARFSGEPAPR